MYINEFFRNAEVKKIKQQAKMLILEKEKIRLKLGKICLSIAGILIWFASILYFLIQVYFLIRGKFNYLNLFGILECAIFLVLWLSVNYLHKHYPMSLKLIKNQDYQFDGEMTEKEIASARLVIDLEQTLIIISPSYRASWIISHKNNPESYDKLKNQYKNKHQNTFFKWYRYYEK